MIRISHLYTLYGDGPEELVLQDIRLEMKGHKKRQFQKSIGMIFQSFALLNRKSVLENMILPWRCREYSSEPMEPGNS